MYIVLAKQNLINIILLHPISLNAKLKLAKNQANANKHPEAELSVFENDSHSSSMLSSKNNRTYSKK